MSAAAISPVVYGHPTLRWAAGGWTFFILENYILSENRTYLIEELGDDRYHAAYGTLSTIATASIGYAYYTIRRTFMSSPSSFSASSIPKNLTLWKSLSSIPPAPNAIGAWICLSLGLIMASQSLPKLQIPLALVQQAETDTTANVPPSTSQHTPQPSQEQPASSGGSYRFQVRCPFDFTDKKMKTLDGNDTAVHGVERISRHSGKFRFKCVSACMFRVAFVLFLTIGLCRIVVVGIGGY